MTHAELPAHVEDARFALEDLLDENGCRQLNRLVGFMLSQEHLIEQLRADREWLSEQLRSAAEASFRIYEERERDRRALREEHKA